MRVSRHVSNTTLKLFLFSSFPAKNKKKTPSISYIMNLEKWYLSLAAVLCERIKSQEYAGVEAAATATQGSWITKQTATRLCGFFEGTGSWLLPLQLWCNKVTVINLNMQPTDGHLLHGLFVQLHPATEKLHRQEALNWPLMSHPISKRAELQSSTPICSQVSFRPVRQLQVHQLQQA